MRKNQGIHTGIGTSDSHIKHKFKSSRDKIIEIGFEAVKYAKTFVNDVEFMQKTLVEQIMIF